MKVDDFDFELPEDRIALHPVEPRDASRLLHLTGQGQFEDRMVRDLPDILRPGDALVLNDTKVIPAELKGVRRRKTPHGTGEAIINVNLHQKLTPDTWAAFARPAKRVEVGEIITFSDKLQATVTGKGRGGEITLHFSQHRAALDEAIATHGVTPLPPYISQRRSTTDADTAAYQTVYAREPGAVAAPTAGLHLTDRLINALSDRGISHHFVTLHVGAGTFLPVKSQTTEGHEMHSETGTISRETADALNTVRAKGGRIVPVGTTSLRILETAADDNGAIDAWSGSTDIFITPGYRFKATDLLITNFHLPRSTLFMLVSAFCGLERMKAAYAHAIEANYRFYSYGDACLLEPHAQTSRSDA